MQMRIASFVCALCFVMSACASRPDIDHYYRAVARGVCVEGIRGLRVEARYGDDSVVGKVSGDGVDPLSFYVGDYPDLDGPIAESEVDVRNEFVEKAVRRQHVDGRFTVALQLKHRKRPDEVVVFWSMSELAGSQSFLRVAKSIRACDIKPS